MCCVIVHLILGKLILHGRHCPGVDEFPASFVMVHKIGCFQTFRCYSLKSSSVATLNGYVKGDDDFVTARASSPSVVSLRLVAEFCSLLVSTGFH